MNGFRVNDVTTSPSSISSDDETAGPEPVHTHLHLVHMTDAQRVAHLQEALEQRTREYENLQGAIDSSRRIGAAIGIVMAAMKITEDEAFDVLIKISQRQNRKLRFIADDIVLTGTF